MKNIYSLINLKDIESKSINRDLVNILKIERFSIFISKQEKNNSILNNFDNDYIRQKDLINHPDSISKEDMKFLYRLMEKCICKIKCKNNNYGTGFFCRFPFPDKSNLLPVLITSSHVFGTNDIYYGNQIKFSLDDDKVSYKIFIDFSRRIYISELYEVTIIEIKEDDNLNIYGLEIDDDVYNSQNLIKFNQKSILLIHYPNFFNVENSSGVIKSISLDTYNIQHFCSAQKGSLGGPLLNSSNFKIIGIHKGNNEIQKYNLGTYIKGPILDFNEIYKNANKDKYIFLKSVDLIMDENGINSKIKLNDRCVFFFDSGNIFARYAIVCSGEDIFSNIERKLFDRFPMLKEKRNIVYLREGKKIDPHKTINQNGCGNGLPIKMLYE